MIQSKLGNWMRMRTRARPVARARCDATNERYASTLHASVQLSPVSDNLVSSSVCLLLILKKIEATKAENYNCV